MDNLILDIGGVIVHDPMHEFFFELESLGNRDREETKAWYLEKMRHPLWSGTMSEEDFWEEIIRFTGTEAGPDYWRSFIRTSSRLMPAASRLKELSETYTLYALSNHRHEWIRPVLEEEDIHKYFQEIFISSEIGEVKPDPSALQFVLEETGVDALCSTYVDDKERNLVPARGMSLNVVQADPDGDWIEKFI